MRLRLPLKPARWWTLAPLWLLSGPALAVCSGHYNLKINEFVPDPEGILRKSAISAVGEDRKRLERELGSHDRHRLDAYLPALPLFFQTHTLADTASSSALDFALRFHQPNLNPDAWFLREFTSDVSADERSYAQAHLWQEESDGSLSLIATMSQACILRGKPPSQGKL